MKTIKPQGLYITAIIIIITFVLWIASLFVVYLRDDQVAPAADERSVPPPKTY